MTYLLDTSTCIFFLRGLYAVDDQIRQRGLSNCFVSEITLLELRFGAENSLNPVKAHMAVDQFMGGIAVLPIFGLAKNYAIEKVRLRNLGTPLHDEFDLLIGITAVTYNLILVTDNQKDFERISGIRLENWVIRTDSAKEK